MCRLVITSSTYVRAWTLVPGGEIPTCGLSAMHRQPQFNYPIEYEAFKTMTQYYWTWPEYDIQC
jgi:hypothetical protein